MQHKLLSIGAELDKGRCKEAEMRELNDTKKSFSCLFREIVMRMFYEIQTKKYNVPYVND